MNNTFAPQWAVQGGEGSRRSNLEPNKTPHGEHLLAVRVSLIDAWAELWGASVGAICCAYSPRGPPHPN